ncbi:MAG: HAD-IA family hydrolase [Thiomargarita sp.]|nr:HAD-IA family hydrolase [Thiomargarita sp.]
MKIKQQIRKKCLAERFWIPVNTQAMLWDMDGVLIDSLSLDLIVCNQILEQYFGQGITISKPFIRSLFAYDSVKFWKIILETIENNFQIQETEIVLPDILKVFHQARHSCVFELHLGIIEILQVAQNQNVKMAVVSNNTRLDVEDILNRCNIAKYFDYIVGNDIEKVAKKPAPDTYLLGAKLLGVDPKKCVVVEDSVVGANAGFQAQCHVIGVATGGDDFEVLIQSDYTQQVYNCFKIPTITMQFGDVKQKKIHTPNDFVSHMIEHIAWRLCVEIELDWLNNDWFMLGEYLGKEIAKFKRLAETSAALGMIDDGSAEVAINFATDVPNLQLKAIDNLDLNWFLALRCEQISSGQPLVELMQGLVNGLNCQLTITICSVEDPHHSWEGVFRAIGIALSKIFTPRHADILLDNYPIERNVSQGEISVLAKSLYYSCVSRGTAESFVEIAVDFSKQRPNKFDFKVAPSIKINELQQLLELLANKAGFTIQVNFNATVLSSSHVVLEDTALVLGRALLEILTLRMLEWGVNGAGSSVNSKLDLEEQAIRVGLSIEGRKFWQLLPFNFSNTQLRQEFIIGQTIYQDLRSEDLDDFLDGLAGGLACSILIHIQQFTEPTTAWSLIFENLGLALKEAFANNPYRKGLPPGVKATLS